ncbi:hypothetical protein BDD12DRAFT_836726 [Trichophaea hybrida]|nr:hypothetical protein BDD12DRAFT_836726 [Trichophaea hybrida]
MALHAYRTLLRSAKLAFAGDTPVLSAAITESRKGFEANRYASANAAKDLIKGAHEIADVLRKNVVQGRKVQEEEEGKGVYSMAEVTWGD